MSSDDFAIEVNDLVKSYDGKSNQLDHLNFKVPMASVMKRRIIFTGVTKR